ncbi:MAG: hypothetical protein BWX54_01970 [Verrucomicrobia bacterium ADurb.Bin018]|nr:MAG: hypothetical protein BWX54_01970 [Verrucomicrobia bacterium ADurb.Bin018]
MNRWLDPPESRCHCGHVYDDHDEDDKCLVDGCECQQFEEWTAEDERAEQGDQLCDERRGT